MNSGGAERVAANLVNAWAARGDKVTLVLTYSGRGECFYPLAENVELIFLADQAGVLGGGLQASWVRFRTLHRLIRRRKPEVLVSFLTSVNVAAILAAFGTNCRALVSERTNPAAIPLTGLSGWLRIRTYPFAKRVILQTSEGLAWLQSHIPRARGMMIPNPIQFPMAIFEPRLWPDHYVHADRNLLLAVGRLDHEKGFDVLLTTFAQLAERFQRWDLVILGQGAERESLQNQIERLGLGGRACLPGHAGNVGDWYTRADLFVLSSRSEGFPNSLIEAMACGCAAISYDCDTGPRDIIRHEYDGLLVRPAGSVPALAQALERAMGDDKLRVQLGTRATEVRKRYSMSSVLEMWDEVFEARS